MTLWPNTCKPGKQLLFHIFNHLSIMHFLNTIKSSYLVITSHQFPFWVKDHIGIVLIAAITWAPWITGITGLHVSHICNHIDGVIPCQTAQSFQQRWGTKPKQQGRKEGRKERKHQNQSIHRNAGTKNTDYKNHRFKLVISDTRLSFSVIQQKAVVLCSKD